MFVEYYDEEKNGFMQSQETFLSGGLLRKLDLMSKIISVYIFIFCCWSTLSFCQDRKNHVGVEFLGHGMVNGSVFYERYFYFESSEKISLSARIGVGHSPKQEINDRSFKGVTSVPFVLSLIYGKEHAIQFGMGYTPLFSEDFINDNYNPSIVYKKFESDLTISLGYRYISEGGVVIRAYPAFAIRDKPNHFQVGFGLGLGYAF